MSVSKMMVQHIWAATLCGGTLFLGVPSAWAMKDRVMASAQEGAVLRMTYIQKMQKLDDDKKQCRKLLEQTVFPQLALLDELSQVKQAGPTRHVKDEAQLRTHANKLAHLKNELLRLQQQLIQLERINDARLAGVSQQFEKRLREYNLTHKNFESISSSLVEKSDKLVSNFVPFAKAVLHIKQQSACEFIWADLRSLIPVNMEQAVLKQKTKTKQQVAALQGDFQGFSVNTSRWLQRFKAKLPSSVAGESFGE